MPVRVGENVCGHESARDRPMSLGKKHKHALGTGGVGTLVSCSASSYLVTTPSFVVNSKESEDTRYPEALHCPKHEESEWKP